MFSFAWPWAALLFPLPWLLRRFWPANTLLDPSSQRSEYTQSALRHPRLGQIVRAYQHAPLGLPSFKRLSAGILAALWALLVLAMMHPQWLREYTQVQQRGYDLMLAVDLSRSMLALDFTVSGQRVNRLQVVKGVVGKFIAQRQGDRIGLILFGDAAYIQSPLTLDGEAVRAMLEQSVPRMAGDATAIGDAIGLAVKKLRDRPQGSRILILLTDGENTAGSLPPQQAAALAAQYGIRIYTIGVGSQGEVPFPDASGHIGYEKMALDEPLLTQVAEAAGGKYFRATDTHALEEIYKHINTLEKTEAETRRVWLPQPLYQAPLGLAMWLMLLAVWLQWRERNNEL